MAITINAKTSGAGGLETTADNTGNINIQSGGSTVMSISSTGVSVTGSFSQDGAVYSTQPSFRNLIINGDMRIDQRNGGSANTINVDGEYTLDRWKANSIQAPTYNRFTVQQVTDAPDNAINSLKVTSLVSYTVTSGDYHLMQQRIEGNNTAHLGWGTSAAKTVTLSFWVKSSLTGTFGGSVRNSAGTRSYPFTYAIASANTWEKKTITVTGDTTGTWDTDTTSGIIIYLGLGVGSTYSGTAGSWAGTNYLSATGATSVVGTSGATWQITNVQLEVGSTATDFENLPYDVQLQRCQRYYYKIAGLNGQGLGCVGYVANSQVGTMTTTFPVQMRIRPTALETTGTASDYSIRYLATATVSNTVPSFYTASLQAADVQFFVPTTTLTAGQGCMSRAASNSAYLAWSAEL